MSAGLEQVNDAAVTQAVISLVTYVLWALGAALCGFCVWLIYLLIEWKDRNG